VAGYVQEMVALPPTVHHSSAQNAVLICHLDLIRYSEYKNDSLLGPIHILHIGLNLF